MMVSDVAELDANVIEFESRMTEPETARVVYGELVPIPTLVAALT